MDKGSLPSTMVVVVQEHPTEDRPFRGSLTYEEGRPDVAGHQLAQRNQTRQVRYSDRLNMIYLPISFLSLNHSMPGNVRHMQGLGHSGITGHKVCATQALLTTLQLDMSAKSLALGHDGIILEASPGDNLFLDPHLVAVADYYRLDFRLLAPNPEV